MTSIKINKNSSPPSDTSFETMPKYNVNKWRWSQFLFLYVYGYIFAWAKKKKFILNINVVGLHAWFNF